MVPDIIGEDSTVVQPTWDIAPKLIFQAYTDAIVLSGEVYPPGQRIGKPIVFLLTKK